MQKGEISEGSGLRMLTRESNEGGTTMMSKPRQYLYIILDDWVLGYSIHKVDLDSDQLIPIQLGCNAREVASYLPPPWIRFMASHESLFSFSDAMGSKILALHPKEEGNYDWGGFCFDIHEGSLSYVPRHTHQLRPIYFPIGNRLFALGGFSMELLDLQPLVSSSSQLDALSWCKVSDPPFDSVFVISHAILPDSQTIFVSVHNSKTTYSFHMAGDGSFKWKKHGDWLLPFVGRGHFDSKLNAWVGIALYQEEPGHICSCELASATPGQRPDVKYSKECLFSEDPVEAHVGATLIYMGQESKYCLVECIECCYRYDFEPKKADPHVSLMFRLTAFCLKIDENGDLTTGGSQRVRYYKAPNNEVSKLFLLRPQVFWV
ncbi:unnamed protein product [Urochloa decumbens]|uniref:F-box protein n=1 Tax=Urochloa decumbens TaxID=240449 RepID=A0ABC9GUZ9_9POAL